MIRVRQIKVPIEKDCEEKWIHKISQKLKPTQGGLMISLKD